MRRRARISNVPRESNHLEPRVAKLEVGMERLTEDVANLATVVREQGTQMEQEIQKLVVAVTQAAGPRKTDWSTIIAGIMLVMAIGSAVFWPLNQTTQDTKVQAQRVEEGLDAHTRLDMHPVGLALVHRLEDGLKEHEASCLKEREILRVHFHEELTMLEKSFALQVQALNEKTTLHDERLYGRVVKLEEQNGRDNERDKDELVKWRQKAMGLPDEKVTLTK